MTIDEQTIAPPDPQVPTATGPTLPEEHRKKLDTIVSKMHDNGESDEAIHAVVDDFKKKYSAAPASSVKLATYTTTLKPDEEGKYQQWKSKLPGDLKNDSDYDLRGQFKENPNVKPSANLHFQDTYKKPNHITFSDQSRYNDPKNGITGGHWDEKDGKTTFLASPINIKNAGGADKLQAYFDKYEPDVKLVLPTQEATAPTNSHITPDKLKQFQDQQRRASTEPGFKPGVMPLPQMTPEKVKEFNDKIAQNVQQHAKEVTQARENLKKIHDNITPVAQAALKEDLEKDALSKGQVKLQQIGSDATWVNGVPLPGAFPKAPDVTPDMLQKYKDNPENRDYLMHKQLDAYKKAGDTKAANKLQSDLYITDRNKDDYNKEMVKRQKEDRGSIYNNSAKYYQQEQSKMYDDVNQDEEIAVADNPGQRIQNAERLKKGELEYSPISKTLIEPTGFTASIAEGQANRIKDRALFNLADRGDKAVLMKQLDEEIRRDPDEPIKVPKNFMAHIGSFAGEQAVPGIATAVAELIPGIGQAAGAGIQSEEMATRGFSGELRKTYAALLAKGMPKEEALDKALTQAKSAMVIDAATGAILGKAVTAKGPKINIPASSESMLKNAVLKGFSYLKGETPAALTNAGTFMGAQMGKNITANALGDDRSLGEGVLEAGGATLALHYGLGLLGKGVIESPVVVRKLLQGMTKVPEPELRAMGQNLIHDGVLTPEQAASAHVQIEEHKALDAQVPEKVKNDEVRLDLQKKIKRRQDLEEELKTVNKAFHPEVKEKIAALDENMNEIANSDEAKKETPEPEIKPINNEQATSGERGTLPSTEKQVEPPIGSTQPGSRSRRNRAQEVRSEENGGIISARAKEIGVNPEHISVFSDLEDAGAKKGEKARTNSIRRIEEDYGPVKEKADYINDNFSNIEKKLISSKVIKKICP